MRRILKGGVCATLAVSALAFAPAAEACAQASSSNYLRLGGFPSETQENVRWFYYGAEGAPAASEFRVMRISDDCTGSVSRASYEVGSDVAQAGQDFQSTEGETGPLHDPAHGEGPSSQSISVPVIDDGVTEDAVESAQVRLSDPTDAVLLAPSAAPFYVIDNDGATRYSFGSATYTQRETYTQVRIPVFRAGSDVSSPGSVTYTLSPEGENPATPGEDYDVPDTTTVSFPAGDRVQVLAFTIRNDELGEQSESIAIDLEGGSGIARTVLTILDNEESVAPKTRWHHPRHGRAYDYNSWRLREVHVFGDDKGGSGLVKVQFALRRKHKDRSCRWWSGRGFTRRACGRERWIKMRMASGGLLYFYRLPALKPSMGTNVRKYTALSRGLDGARNVETRFVRGRNANSFEIRRR